MVRDNRTEARVRLAGMVEAVIAKTAHDCEADAKRAIQTGPKSGRVYGGATAFFATGKTGLPVLVRFTTKKVHQASAPGQAPASDTGNLANSIRAVRIGKLKWVVAVFAAYGKILEFGGANVLPRPFLIPAYRRAKTAMIKGLRVIRRQGLATKAITGVSRG